MQRGADVIVVVVQWGRRGSYYPDETSLATGRYLASLGVALVIGYHPSLQQQHAYFQDTLVIFSAGNFISSSSSPQLCWQKVLLSNLLYTHSSCGMKMACRLKVERCSIQLVITAVQYTPASAPAS